jgi:hypothetical protein
LVKLFHNLNTNKITHGSRRQNSIKAINTKHSQVGKSESTWRNKRNQGAVGKLENSFINWKIHRNHCTCGVFMRLQLLSPSLINQLLPLSWQWIDVNLEYTFKKTFLTIEHHFTLDYNQLEIEYQTPYQHPEALV